VETKATFLLSHFLSFFRCLTLSFSVLSISIYVSWKCREASQCSSGKKPLSTTVALINTEGDMSNKDPGIRLFGRKIPLPESQIPASSQMGYQIQANSATMVLTHKGYPKAIFLGLI